MSRRIIEGIYAVSERNPLSLLSFAVVIGYFLVAAIGPYLVPLDLIGKSMPNVPPSLEHPFGTDHIGRDVFAQVVHGARDVLILASIAALFTLIIATSAGAIAGMAGGKIDMALTFVTDVILTIPSFPLQIVIAATIRGGSNVIILGLVLSLVAWAAPARSIRSQVLSIKSRDFVEASRCIGLNTFEILTFDIIPLIMPYLVVNALLHMISAIYAIVGLAMIGAIPWSDTNWGTMINIAVNYTAALLNFKPIWYLLAPIFTIIVFQIALIQASATLEAFFNPKLRELYSKK